MIVTCKTSSPYPKLKTKLRRNTLLAGVTLVACNTITGDTLEGISTGIGVATSYAYLDLLIKHVDNIEKSDSIQKQMIIPVGVAVFEQWWNHNFPNYHLNQGDTLVGFLSYQVALMTILYETISEMLTHQSSPSSYEQQQSYTCTHTHPEDLADPPHPVDPVHHVDRE